MSKFIVFENGPFLGVSEPSPFNILNVVSYTKLNKSRLFNTTHTVITYKYACEYSPLHCVYLNTLEKT